MPKRQTEEETGESNPAAGRSYVPRPEDLVDDRSDLTRFTPAGFSRMGPLATAGGMIALGSVGLRFLEGRYSLS